MDAAPGKKDDVAKMVMVGGLMAAAGYVAYRYWYLPEQMRNDVIRHTGGTPDGLRQLGAAGCAMYGAKYGIPPQGSYEICNELSGAAADLVRQFPQLVGGTLQAVGQGVGHVGQGAGQALAYIGQGTGSLLADVGGGAGEGIYGLSHGVAGGLLELGTVPINILGETVGGVYGGVKTVVKDVWYGAGKLLPWNW